MGLSERFNRIQNKIHGESPRKIFLDVKEDGHATLSPGTVVDLQVIVKNGKEKKFVDIKRVVLTTEQEIRSENQLSVDHGYHMTIFSLDSEQRREVASKTEKVKTELTKLEEGARICEYEGDQYLLQERQKLLQEQHHKHDANTSFIDFELTNNLLSNVPKKKLANIPFEQIDKVGIANIRRFKNPFKNPQKP